MAAVRWTVRPLTVGAQGPLWPLTPECIDVLLVFPELAIDQPILDQFAATLDEEEHSRRRRFAFERDRHTFLVSHALVRFALSRYADVQPADWRFVTNRFGRPELADPAIAPGLRFNLSHTAGLIAVAVASGRAVGVDVENVTREFPLEVVESVFARDEIQALRSLPQASQTARLYALWTLKEAYAKARGMGFSLPFREVSLDLGSAQPLEVVGRSSTTGDSERWRLELHRPSEAHCLGLAYEATELGPVQVRLAVLTPTADL